MQCKEIPDEPIIQYLYNYGGIGCTWDGDGRNVAKAMPLGIPSKLVLAKMRSLIKRKLIKGCCCGCRGDFELIVKVKDS